MPRFVRATKYQDAHWLKTETEYRVTTYTRAPNGEWHGDCDHHDKRKDAIAVAKAHVEETGTYAVVERLTWTLGTFDAVKNGQPNGTPRDEEFDDWEGYGPKETLVYGKFPPSDDDE